jgi:hypothetical protein
LRNAFTGSLDMIQNVAQPRPDEKQPSHQRGLFGEDFNLRLRRGDSLRSSVGEESKLITKEGVISDKSLYIPLKIMYGIYLSQVTF